MKRIGYIYENIYDIDNIKEAIYKASEEKREHEHVKQVLSNIEHYAYRVHLLIKNKEYVPTKPKIKTIQDTSNGKVRVIYQPNFFPDQIIHWSLMLQIQPIIMRGMYAYSCGSVPNRGTTYAQDTIRKWLDNDIRNTKYCLKMDIKKFYPSISNELLKRMFERKIKDKDCLWLINTIIDHNDGQPIGFYTSQWFANFFLEGMDHYIKEKLGVKYYVRYVDDLVLFGSNKRKLHRVRKEVDRYTKGIELKIKDNWQVFRVDKRDLDFLGVRFYRNKTTLRSRNALRIRRRVKKIKKKGYLNDKDAAAILSYWGWIKRTDSYSFYHKYVKPVVPIHLARKVVSINAKIRNYNRWNLEHKRKYVARL
jgi:hypothetical protein